MVLGRQTRKLADESKHPYLSGNFSPIQQTLPLTPCSYIGTIPDELSGGEYVRNGGNPVSNEDLGRDAHWFDGDGMLSGVAFFKQENGKVQPSFVNQYILTDVYLSTKTSTHVSRPILPSITTLVNPLSSFLGVTLHIIRTIFLVLLSFLPGSKQSIKKISVANTSILYHDGRALATCESGPPMRVALPGLETVGWYNGVGAEGEPEDTNRAKEEVFGGEGLLSWMREWTTGHPKVDPITKEMVLFHATFLAPYVRYSVIPSSRLRSVQEATPPPGPQGLVNRPVPGISGPKMMHDFGASLAHTVIMDLPLSLDPLNMAKGKPVIAYDSTKSSRFAVFPRHQPEQVRYFETSACCIFHTANTWDVSDEAGVVRTVHMLACRLISSTLVYAAGNIAAPLPKKKVIKSTKRKGISWFEKYDAAVVRRDSHDPTEETALLKKEVYVEEVPDLESPRPIREPVIRLKSNGEIDRTISSLPTDLDDLEDVLPDEEEQCRLYHYAFSLATGHITAQYALSAIPFEFPSLHPQLEMQAAQFIYGCSTTVTSFGAALGKATKINALVKMDSRTLIARGEALLKQGKIQTITGCVDTRSISEISRSHDEADPIKIFRCPEGWYVQEPRFVPRNAATCEDDGFFLTYAFNEAQLNAEGEVPSDDDPVHRARSELWIIDAKNMKTIIGRIELPQRVPYGLHGGWFPEEQIQNQRPIEMTRTTEIRGTRTNPVWAGVRNAVEKMLAQRSGDVYMVMMVTICMIQGVLGALIMEGYPTSLTL